MCIYIYSYIHVYHLPNVTWLEAIQLHVYSINRKLGSNLCLQHGIILFLSVYLLYYRTKQQTYLIKFRLNFYNSLCVMYTCNVCKSFSTIVNFKGNAKTMT